MRYINCCHSGALIVDLYEDGSEISSKLQGVPVVLFGGEVLLANAGACTQLAGELGLIAVRRTPVRYGLLAGGVDYSVQLMPTIAGTQVTLYLKDADQHSYGAVIDAGTVRGWLVPVLLRCAAKLSLGAQPYGSAPVHDSGDLPQEGGA